MRKTLALMVATLALLQAWSVIGQEMQDSLTLDSELDAPEAIKDFLNDTTENDTVNDTVNDTLAETNLSTTASQTAFLDQPVNASLIDTTDPGTLTQKSFLLDEPIEEPVSSYKKGAMMDSWTEESSADTVSSSYTKGQPMA